MTTDTANLTVPEAAKALGIGYTRLDKLIRDGFLGDRPGNRWRAIGFADLLAVAALLRLRRVGVPNRSLRRIVPRLAATPGFAPAGRGSVLLVAGDRFEIVDADRLAAGVAALGAEPAVALGIGPLADEVAGLLDRYGDGRPGGVEVNHG